MPARAARPVRPVRRVVVLALLVTVVSVIMCAATGGDTATIVQTAVLSLVGTLLFGGLAYRNEIAAVFRARRQG